MNKRLLTLAYSLLYGSLLLCVAQVPIMRNFTPPYGNQAVTQNWAISEIWDGRMIFGCNAGVMMYDGDKWETRVMPNFTTVRSVFPDKQTFRIYAGATSEFGYFSSRSSFEPLTYHSLSSSLSVKDRDFGEIWDINRLGTEIVMQAKEHLFVLDQRDNLRQIRIPQRIETATVVGDIYYMVCQNTIYCYHAGQVTELAGANELAGKSVRHILQYNHILYFVTADNGIFRYDGNGVSPVETDLTPLLRDGHVFCVEFHDPWLAIGTVRNGLVLRNVRTKRVYSLNTTTGLFNNTVLSLCFDSLGNIWLGLDNGMAYVMLDMPCLDLFGQKVSIGTGYASLVAGNTLFLGTNQGLFSIPYRQEQVMPYASPEVVPGIEGQVWALRRIDGQVLCAADAGAFVVSDRATRIPGLCGTWDFISLKDHPGWLLACDYNGFVVLRKQGDSYAVANRLAGFSEVSGGFMQDADGSVWVSHWQKGIYRLTLKDDLSGVKAVEYFHKGRGLVIDDNNLVCKIKGRVYVSSVDGFRQYNPKTRQLDKAEWLNKVFDTYGTALRVNESPDGNLWAYKPEFLAVAYPRRGGGYRMEKFSHINIVNQLQMTFGHNSQVDKNTMLMNQTGGFFLLNNHVKKSAQTARLMIRGVYGANAADTVLYVGHHGAAQEELRIPHKLNSLRMEFVLPEYRNNKAAVYQCWLEHYDTRWNEWQTTTFKDYTQLPKGTYVLHVRAKNLVNGFVDETALTLTILPAWYETWFAYIIYIIAASVLVMLALRYIKRRAESEMKREMKEKELQLREQRAQFEMEEQKKEKEVMRLRNAQLEVELKHKAGELADNAMNLVQKNDILIEIDSQMQELSESVRREDAKAHITKKIADIRHGIKINMSDNASWDKFQENFNLVYDNFTQKLMEQFPDLKKNDLKLCVYLRMGLSSKEMASLLNSSVRSIETARYRLRKKLRIEQGDNLSDFIQSLSQPEQ